MHLSELNLSTCKCEHFWMIFEVDKVEDESILEYGMNFDTKL